MIQAADELFMTDASGADDDDDSGDDQLVHSCSFSRFRAYSIVLDLSAVATTTSSSSS